MGAYEAAEIAFRGTRIIPATPEGEPVSSKPMRYRDSEGDIWETVPDASGPEQLLDIATGNTREYDEVLSQYGPLTLVHDDEPAEEAENTPAVGPVYESPEELAAEIVRLREESARAYSQGVEDMRQAAVNDLLKRDSVEWALGGEYGGIDAARIVRNAQVSAQTPSPAPRDTELIQQVRALVKRYGAPAIAAEAARQAKHH